MAVDVGSVAAVLLASFIAPILYLIWIRDAEVFNREPYFSVVRVFVYGATIALGAAFVIETLITGLLAKEAGVLTQFFYGRQVTIEFELFLLLVVIGPIVEELVKASGIFVVYRRLNTLESGLVYGAAVGLGFSAMENVLYLTNATMSGLEVFLVTAVARSLSSALLHASATSVTGYGLARFRLMRNQSRRVGWGRYLLVAMLMHGTFNLLAAVGQIFNVGSILSLALLVVAFLFAITAFRLVRRWIRELDRVSPS
jgi:RsiW-degrading membrane proteinase PrsW (M82 family)